MTTHDDGDWTCEVCGESHHGLAQVFGPPAPDPWVAAPEEVRAAGELNADSCVMPAPDGGQYYFLRGHVELPLRGTDEVGLAWAVWVSLSSESWDLTAQHWDDPDRASLAPMFGWLSNQLPYDAPTSPLATLVHTRAPGLTPLIELDPELDHPLAAEQRDGITWHRVAEINRMLLAT